PAEQIVFERTSEGPVEIRLQPTHLAAYEVAATPDGTRLVVASRVRYEATDLRFFELVYPSGDPAFYCTLGVSRDVYRLSVIEVDSGSVGYEAIKGISDAQGCS